MSFGGLPGDEPEPEIDRARLDYIADVDRRLSGRLLRVIGEVYFSALERCGGNFDLGNRRDGSEI